ncbi:MAG: integrase [Kangiella sp.]|nr:MAG: integrase [Kangiella sp.]
MGSINARKETGLLYFDFRYQNKRCREQTALKDNAANRKRLKEIVKKIDAEILIGIFVYQNYFPNSSNLSKFSNSSTVEIENAIPTFCDFSEDWLQEMIGQWRPSNYKKANSYLNLYLLPEFGSQRVNEISKSQIMKFRSYLVMLEPKLSPSYINHIINPLRMILQEAGDRYDFVSTCKDVRSLKVPKTDVDPFSLDEVNLIIKSCRKDYKNYVITRFFTGMRSAEINGLLWKNVDFKRKLILVRQALIGNTLMPTKTDGSVRDILMSSIVFDALKEQKKASNNLSEFVFCNSVGNPIDGDNFRKWIWYPLLRYLNLEKRTPYTTRHTAATIWLASGESPDFIAKQMGHNSTEMLFSVYSRFVPNLTRNDGSAMEKLIKKRIV